MSKQTVRFALDLTIHDGKLEVFEDISQVMTSRTLNEPGALEYEWYFSSDRKRCRLIEVYADADAMLKHLMGPVVQELVPKILEVSSISRFEVYGDPGVTAGERLKAFGAEFFEFRQGLGR
jgi:quinol monooxygenase YgiN